MTAGPTCPTCDTEPRAGARFCDACGSPIAVADTHALKGAVTRLRNIESVFDAYRVTPGAAALQG